MLERRLREAPLTGADHLDVNAGDLHREVGVYPKSGHAMPTCCAVMRAAMNEGDLVLLSPPSGYGANLTIRYRLPRRKTQKVGRRSRNSLADRQRRVVRGGRVQGGSGTKAAPAHLSVHGAVAPEGSVGASLREAGRPGGDRIGLVGCVKRKLGHAAPAADLYMSPLFVGRRAYVECSCERWLILSALHGVVSPAAILEPYDVTLNDASRTERRIWAEMVLGQLEREIGDLGGLIFEIHAGANYADFGLLDGLRARGAKVERPTAGLSLGQQLAFYASQGGAQPVINRGPSQSDRGPEVVAATSRDVEAAIEALDRSPTLVAASCWPADLTCLDHPGLYAWWVDEGGAADLSDGLGAAIAAGRIYVGQAGATKWPSGAAGTSTLGERIGLMHLGDKVRFSTFRWTLAAVLGERLGLRVRAPMVLDSASEQSLSKWMSGHLTIAVHPYDDRDGHDALERAVLARLDPPLNLQHMPRTPLRLHLVELRRRISRAKAPDRSGARQSLPSPFQPGDEYPPGSYAEFGSGDLERDMWLRPNPALTDEGDILLYAISVDGYEYARVRPAATSSRWSTTCDAAVSGLPSPRPSLPIYACFCSLRSAPGATATRAGASWLRPTTAPR